MAKTIAQRLTALEKMVTAYFGGGKKKAKRKSKSKRKAKAKKTVSRKRKAPRRRTVALPFPPG